MQFCSLTVFLFKFVSGQFSTVKVRAEEELDQCQGFHRLLPKPEGLRFLRYLGRSIHFYKGTFGWSKSGRHVMFEGCHTLIKSCKPGSWDLAASLTEEGATLSAKTSFYHTYTHPLLNMPSGKKFTYFHTSFQIGSVKLVWIRTPSGGHNTGTWPVQGSLIMTYCLCLWLSWTLFIRFSFDVLYITPEHLKKRSGSNIRKG